MRLRPGEFGIFDSADLFRHDPAFFVANRPLIRTFDAEKLDFQGGQFDDPLIQRPEIHWDFVRSQKMMQNHPSDKRQSRRYDARKLRYRATLIMGKDPHEVDVLDFSANGIQIETPLSLPVSSEGTLEFRGNQYRYQVKHETSDLHSRRLGMETHVLQGTVASSLGRTAPYHTEHFTGQGYFQRKRWSIACSFVIAAGLCVAFVMTSDPDATREARNNQSVWEKLARTLTQSSKNTAWNQPHNATGPSGIFNSMAPIENHSTSKARSVSAKEVLNQAYSFFNQANFDAAVEACTVAISKDHRNAEVWHLRGNAYRNLTRYEQAISDLKQAISLNATAPLIHADLAEAFCDAGRFTEGIKQVEQGFKLAADTLRSRFKGLATRAYKGRSANRLIDGDQDGAAADLAKAEHWNRL